MCDQKTNPPVRSNQEIGTYFSVFETKVLIDIGRGLAALFIGLAAFMLATFRVWDSRDGGSTYAQLFLLFSVLNILLASKVMDWLLDRIDAGTWAKLLDYKTNLEFSAFTAIFQKWDGAYFRMRIFGGAYAIFSLMISLIASASLYLSIERAQDSGLLISISNLAGIQTPFKLIICLMLFLYIPYQMLTLRSRGGPYFFTIIISIISIVLIEAILSR